MKRKNASGVCVVKENFQKALRYTIKTHPSDLKWIKSRNTLTSSFKEFYEEYTYVVIASGFRGRTAAKLTPLLINCKGEFDSMYKIFKNERKCKALSTVWRIYGIEEKQWQLFRDSLDTVEKLETLPYIGPVTKFHLARNIGLENDIVKPDLHLLRYASELGFETPRKLVEHIHDYEEYNHFALGTIDFILWVWLSHSKGEKELKCCNGGFRIR